MSKHVLVWDLETVPDLAAVSRIHGIDERNEEACGRFLARNSRSWCYTRLSQSAPLLPIAKRASGTCDHFARSTRRSQQNGK